MIFSLCSRRQIAGIHFVIVLFALGGCSKPQTLRVLFEKNPLHQVFSRPLSTPISRRPTDLSWQAAASQALSDSLVVPLPCTETGYCRTEQPAANSYRYAVRAGEQIHVSLSRAAGTAGRVFVDVFALRPGQAPVLVASEESEGLDFRYRAPGAGQHLLRVQPELLATGRYTLRLRREPGLSHFPVAGRGEAAIASFWGADRDGGARRHQGIDIMAPRGTPAIAAATGYITGAGQNQLGGRIVWLADIEHGQQLYYAHLDRQLVHPGQRVRAGDTLGLVGNTGNARNTEPHLHFGVYRAGRVAVDPLPFVRRAEPAPALPSGPDYRGEFVRLRTKGQLLANARLSSRPTRMPAGAAVTRQLPLLVLGQQGAVLRVLAPDGRQGYVAAKAIAAAAKSPLRRLALPAAVELLAQPAATAPTQQKLRARTAVAVLGQANGFTLLRGPHGELGWALI
jgi:murein DD-endopeptidase MepM/ murein hydrolase activator NlpD